ncbi:MAG TPA: A/G-specific adenine glycosylase [Desulfomonilaceae bacterium]|nr:A/G-specific adenine glycosylase [Desulfomonilaceae bacterium]
METKSSDSMTRRQVNSFRRTIYEYFDRYGRKLAWRDTDDPYRILVSEIMLQQTQVERVITKYHDFIGQFPDFTVLAAAPLRLILAAWQGLGYNRRAIWLRGIAVRTLNEFNGVLPSSPEILLTFPGIGRSTAGALAAFAFRKPAVFIETNIRRVFIHFFFCEKERVKDAEILPYVQRTLDRPRVREWYYALMDYGVMLRSLDSNPNRRSAHYARQSPFIHSDRQIRGSILRILLETPVLSEDQLLEAVGKDERLTKKLIAQLVREGFLHRSEAGFTISRS